MNSDLRIIRLRAENFKRLKLIDISPKGDLIQITGKNGSGKTSVLDAIMCAISGRGAAPTKPIRDGADEAVIRVDLGDYEITRVFNKDDKQPPILVRPKNGAAGMKGKAIRSAQDLLDKLYGDLTFDPLAFARMPAKYQYEELRRIAGLGDDLEEFDKLNAEDYAERTRWNRIAKDAKSAADAIDVPDDLPTEPVNVAVLADELEKASRHNSQVFARRQNRAHAVTQVEDLQARAAKIEAETPGEIERINIDRDKRTADLMRQIQELNIRANKEIAALKSKAEPLHADALALQAKLDTAEPLPELKDVLAFKEKISNAQLINAGIDQREKRLEKLRDRDQAEKKSRDLTQAMDSRTEQKQAMIDGAKFPVRGLGVADGQVTYNKIPFGDCSSAEQLRVSVAIAMAANPTLKILRIKDGSLLDSNGLKILSDMAEKHGFQIWLECVDESGEIGIVLEDGAVIADHSTDAEPASLAG